MAVPSGVDDACGGDAAWSAAASVAGVATESHAEATFVPPALTASKGAASATVSVELSDAAAPGSGEIAAAAAGASELEFEPTDQVPAGSGVAPFGSDAAIAAPVDASCFATVTVWVGGARPESKPIGSGVATTPSPSLSDSGRAEPTRAVNASPISLTSAPDPSCAAPTPAEPAEVSRAAEPVWMPNIIARESTSARGRPGASAEAKQPMRQVPRPQRFYRSGSIYTLFSPTCRRGAAGRGSFLPTSALGDAIPAHFGGRSALAGGPFWRALDRPGRHVAERLGFR